MNNVEHAVILIDKPVGQTSFETISEVRRLLGISKIGHSGTLDKYASGLLVTCTGQATKLTQYFIQDDKRYTATIRYGVSTDSLDRDGMVLEERPTSSITRENIMSASMKMKGEILQRPPLFSAIKVKGKRASDLTREGTVVSLDERMITILDFAVYDIQLDNARFSIDIHCSKGTYVRSIARDIGEDLGTGAYLESLRRISSGPFFVTDAATVDEVSAYARGASISKNFVKKPTVALDGNGFMTVNRTGRDKIAKGVYFSRQDVIDIQPKLGKMFIIVDEEKNLVAIADVDTEIWQIRFKNVFIAV